MGIFDILTCADPIYDDRAARYLGVCKRVVQQHNQPGMLKGLIDKAIDRRLAANTKESRAMATAIWDKTDAWYPGLLDRPRPAPQPTR